VERPLSKVGRSVLASHEAKIPIHSGCSLRLFASSRIRHCFGGGFCRMSDAPRSWRLGFWSSEAFHGRQQYSGVIFLACSFIGLFTSLGITRVAAADPAKHFRFNFLGDLWTEGNRIELAMAVDFSPTSAALEADAKRKRPPGSGQLSNKLCRGIYFSPSNSRNKHAIAHFTSPFGSKEHSITDQSASSVGTLAAVMLATLSFSGHTTFRKRRLQFSRIRSRTSGLDMRPLRSERMA
jgi:hypothetical protein